MDVLPTPSRKKRSKDYIPPDAPLPLFDEQLQLCESIGPKKCHIGFLQPKCVLVKDNQSMRTLYCKGFFGKGTLSRAGPHLCYPARNKNSNANVKSEPSADDHTSDEDEQQSDNSEPEDMFSEEALQLSFMEAYFLSYGLGCLVVMDEDQPLDLETLWHKFCELTPGGEFPYLYTAYHHFRSKGWIVRSGIKYGANYLLYKEGPCYYHSTFAVIVKPVSEKGLKDIQGSEKLPMTWENLAAKNRLLSHVSKALVFFYVIKPESLTEEQLSLPTCLSDFKVEEIHVKRFVSSLSRSEEEDS